MPRNLENEKAAKLADSRQRMMNLMLSFKEHPQAEDFARRYLKITPKGAGSLIPFEYNRCQRKLDAAYNKAAFDKDGNPQSIRLLILKPRQIGCSTWCQCMILQAMLRLPNSNGITISYESDSSKHILDMLKRFYNNLPDYMQVPDRYSNRNELWLDEPHNGHLFVQTAGVGKGKTGAGHSRTIQMLHASELGAWEDKSRVWDGLMNAFNAKDPNSIAIFESSSWGSGNWHEDFWNQTVAGETGFTPVFLSWLDHEEYELPNMTWESLGTLDEDERKLKNDYDATPGQLAWRRWMIRVTFKGQRKPFKQWYPSTPQEAFQSETNLFLDESKLEWRKSLLKDPIFKGELHKVGRGGGGYDIQLKPDPNGGLYIWEHPKDKEMYIVAGDPSDSRQDPSAMVVLKRNTGDIVATWNNPMDYNSTSKRKFARVRVDEFTKKIFLLGKYYNYAILAVEANSLGVGVNNKLMEMGYWNLYRQLRGERYLMTKTEKLGWWTGAGERKDMLYNLTEYISANPDTCESEKLDAMIMRWRAEKVPESEIKELADEYKKNYKGESGYYWDKRLQRELEHFIEIKQANKHGAMVKKKPQASPGSTDDLIMAFMIAIMVWREKGKARNVGRVTYTYTPLDSVTGV